MVGVVMMRGWAEVRALKLTITSDDNDMIEHDFLKPDVMTFEAVVDGDGGDQILVSGANLIIQIISLWTINRAVNRI